VDHAPSSSGPVPRVSTDRQETECQRPEVEQLARVRGFEVVKVFEEKMSAAKVRPEYAKMMKEARRGAFDVIVVWAIDRFGRSMIGNVSDVLELDRVRVVSVRESWLDTGSPVRTLLLAIFSWLAEQERVRIGERTRAGMAAARRRESRVGRPRARLDEEQLREPKSRGMSVRKIAAAMNIGTATVQRHLAAVTT
jgi:putative DNA-invertase from lambdoid prophage Rac